MIYAHVISEEINGQSDLLVTYRSCGKTGKYEFGKREFECIFWFFLGFQSYLDEEAPIKVPGIEKRFTFYRATDKELTETEINNEIANHLANDYTLAPVTI